MRRRVYNLLLSGSWDHPFSIKGPNRAHRFSGTGCRSVLGVIPIPGVHIRSKNRGLVRAFTGARARPRLRGVAAGGCAASALRFIGITLLLPDTGR